MTVVASPMVYNKEKIKQKYNKVMEYSTKKVFTKKLIV